MILKKDKSSILFGMFRYERRKELKHSKCGVTLIELLIVISIVGIVSLAAYNSLSIGIKVWERNQRIVIEEDVVLFFSKMNNDLKNTFVYSQIGFEGEESKISFPSFVKYLSENEYSTQIGRVEYFFDNFKKELYKRQAYYGQALNDVFGPSQLLLHSVDNVKFHYCYLSEEKEVFRDKVIDGRIPLGVEIEVEFFDGSIKRMMRKFVEIPIGN